jgi:hypothetical protein
MAGGNDDRLWFLEIIKFFGGTAGGGDRLPPSIAGLLPRDYVTGEKND